MTDEGFVLRCTGKAADHAYELPGLQKGEEVGGYDGSTASAEGETVPLLAKGDPPVVDRFTGGEVEDEIKVAERADGSGDR